MSGRLFLLLILALSLCANEQKSEVFVYDCSDNYHFVAEVTNKSAWLFLPSETLQAKKVEGSNPIVYTKGAISYSLQGYKASIVLKNRNFTCQNDGIAATFEKAKLSGVAFRAIGNEPGWILEVTSDTEVVLITNLGESTTAFEVVEKFSDGYSMEYKMKSTHNTLFVRIESRVCKDTMVDREYESTVYINFDGVNMQGCGKPLY